MSDKDKISVELIGRLLREVQAEQRTQRAENELFRKELGRLAGAMVTRDLLSEVMTMLVDRIGNFEALMESRFDRLDIKLANKSDE